MSDPEIRSNHKLFKVTISTIKHAKNTNTGFIALNKYNDSSYENRFL